MFNEKESKGFGLNGRWGTNDSTDVLCGKYGVEIYPEYYKGVHGIEYKLSDIIKPKG